MVAGLDVENTRCPASTRAREDAANQCATHPFSAPLWSRPESGQGLEALNLDGECRSDHRTRVSGDPQVSSLEQGVEVDARLAILP